MITVSFLAVPNLALASTFDEIDGVGSGGTEGLFDDMNALLIIVLSLAGFWIIFCIIFAGAKLASSQGNPQNRTQGFIGLGMALIGGFVIYKCLEIAGWIEGFGS